MLQKIAWNIFWKSVTEAKLLTSTQQCLWILIADIQAAIVTCATVFVAVRVTIYWGTKLLLLRLQISTLSHGYLIIYCFISTICCSTSLMGVTWAGKIFRKSLNKGEFPCKISSWVQMIRGGLWRLNMSTEGWINGNLKVPLHNEPWEEWI